ncbi:GNAT family N-acetyltransferase [Notoacmeibacter sp. MSK16QG-6]|uniref:GNAT family N-acetyltransferase n=1 Tax=Notoacmeibacter sp. MSK16QG-6 TaxID=2957982 RepID=UPI0020A18FF7|nr:GNAT family N-acetyltransferase [Notoacmeibacter sp. MSK16QG-6]MCP1199241.1 GNAT family N-acetyltransferase [Notoacmeibacter sp. MSK16QG-6]
MNTLSIDIRNASRSDASGIAATHHESWRGAYAGIIPHTALTKMIAQRGEDWWVRALSRSASVLVAEFGDEIVGYTTYGRNRTKELPQKGEVYELYLHPQYQGIGIGSRLFAAARQKLEDSHLNGTVVWALEDNHIAQQFYAGHGGHDIAEGVEQLGGASFKKVAFVWA